MGPIMSFFFPGQIEWNSPNVAVEGSGESGKTGSSDIDEGEAGSLDQQVHQFNNCSI